MPIVNKKVKKGKKRPFGNLDIGISASTLSLESALASALPDIFFALKNFFEKIEYLCSFLCLVMASVPLCNKYLFLYDFVHPKMSIGVLEKDYLNYRKHRPIGILKK